MTTMQPAAAEVIPWRAMTSDERNALIAEKVMGLRVEHWTDKEARFVNEDGEEEVHDLRTGYVVIDGQFNPGVPRYSEDLNAAWEMLRHLDKYGSAYARTLFFAQLGRVDEIGHVTMLWATLMGLTAEKLCVTALLAMGYKVML